MATFYLDPVGGNDANDGTTFANRWQTLTTGATAARIAAGDTIRIIASPDATSMAQNATWTNGSQGVTLTSAVTADVYQSGAWTAATTNVTLTTSTNRKLGASSVSIAPNATFTTGKAAYLTLSSTNFSAYQQISFWINMTAGAMTADGDISIRLCSDTTGDVTVNTISIPRIRATSTWQAYTVDLGTALGSAIQSVALYIDVDRGAQTFLLNNIIACKASSADDSLSLTSLISKNTGDEPWFAIQSIVGTTVTLSFNPQYSLATNVPKFYAGSTATQTLFKREPIILPSAIVGTSSTTVTFGTILDRGTSDAAKIIVSGGWNRTDMSTQTGESYISGVNCTGAGIMFGATTGCQYLLVEKINPYNFARGIWCGNSSSFTLLNSTINCRDVSHNSVNNIDGSGTGSGNTDVWNYNTFNITNSIGCGGGSNTSGAIVLGPVQWNTFNIVNLSSNFSAGLSLGGSTALTISTAANNIINITNCSENGFSATGGAGIYSLNSKNNKVTTVDAVRNVASAIQCVGDSLNTFTVTGSLSSNRASSSITSGIIFLQGGSCGNIFNLGTASVTGGSNGSVVRLIQNSDAVFYNGTYVGVGNTKLVVTNNSNAIFFNSTLSGTGTDYQVGVTAGDRSVIRFGNYGGSTTDQRTYISGPVNSSILTDTTVRHTASGVSWAMTVGNTINVTSAVPLKLPVAKIAVNASSLVTATLWVYRTDTSLVTDFVCPGGQIAGVTNDVVATASGAINTWEQLTITFTPTQAGVVALEVNCYGAEATVYVDDFGATQA